MDLAFSNMAARSKISPARWRRPFLSWMDGIEAGWAIPLLLIGFVAVWMAFLIIAYLGGDLHYDVLETWTLGRSLDWSYSKHPPLMGWVARAWTSVFPLTNWSFQLMALTNAALALWAVDLISRRFVRGDKRMIVLLLLMLLPIYQLHAQRFNANAVLLAVWPLATYCFLRSFETSEIRWAVAAGATAALAMLGKYYSVFLIASFVFAAICHPQRRAYFTSWAPWVSLVTLFTALLPHLNWLAANGAPPFVYALTRHTGKDFAPALLEAVLFILGVGLILAIPAAVWALMAQDRIKRFSEDFWAMHSGLLLLFLVSIGTIAFPVITSVALGADMPPLWALQGLFLFVVLIVCGASYQIERFYSVNLAVTVVGMALVAVVVAAPLHAIYRNSHPLNEGRNFYSQAAAELTRRWHEQSDAALAAVGGDDGLAFAMAFYSPDHPVYQSPLVYPHTETSPGEASFSRGWAALCYDVDTDCIAAMERTAARAGRYVRTGFVVDSTLVGQPGASQGFAALMVPPYDEDKAAPPPPASVPAIAEAQTGSEGAPVPARQDEPTCCTRKPRLDAAEHVSEFSVPEIAARESDRKHGRRAAAAAATAYQANWPDRPASSSARDGFARWPIPTPPPRAKSSVARSSPGARPASQVCRGPSVPSGREQLADSTSLPLSVRFKRRFCAMAADFDERMRVSQEKFDLFVGNARGSVDRRLQLWRRDTMAEQQRRGI
jgi:4-amino-4-deoxy-L-arabinose transferase-like glycosyltransferase